MITWHRRYSQVHFLAGHPYLNTPILRQALFRDAHRAAHHLDPRHNGGMKLFGVVIHFNKLAINTITYPQCCLHRLKVNITCRQLKRLKQHGGHHSNNRSVIIGGVLCSLFGDYGKFSLGLFLQDFPSIVLPDGEINR